MYATKFIALILLIDPFPASSEAEEKQAYEGWLTYTGAWFKIQCPTNFYAVFLSKSSTDLNGYDSAKFVSAKDGIEFYVFSPQWSGLETNYMKEITPQFSTERVETDKTTTKDYVVRGTIIETNAITIRTITIAAKDSSYKRTYEITNDNIRYSRLIFGFRYPDKVRFKRYEPVYDKFKRSLVQFAD